MWEVIEYLKDPHLVALVQEYYGVKVTTEPLNCRGYSKNTDVDSDSGNGTCHLKDEIKKRKINHSFQHRLEDNGEYVVNKADENIKHNGYLLNHDDYETVSSESETESKDYIVTNWLWYYVFVLGTALGDEIFYASFIPFWFWNIDGAVGRRVVLVWTIVMYIGQGIKDIVRWPRPACPPVVRLQKKWALEYGMPSTHAMVGVSIPFSVILYTMNRYQYPVFLGVVFAVLWCTVICVSRLYLGMHTVLDIVVGVLLALLLMIPVVPLVDALDYYLLTKEWSPIFLFSIAILLVVFYPSSDRWTPTRGDTTMVVSVCVGVHVGAWMNYQVGILQESSLTPPYAIIWPSYPMMGLGALRTVIGFCCIIATRALCKSASYATICALLRLNSQELKKSQNTIENTQKITVELSYKFITYVLMGFNTVYLLPNVFRLIGIERPTFYTEI
ncbi:hypothetical protein R5R35_014684 [Gryllus longicercus]